MIWELAVAYGCVKLINRLNKGDRYGIEKEWNGILEELNYRNDEGQGYYISKSTSKPYGYSLEVEIPRGFSFEKFEKNKSIFETNMGNKIEMEPIKGRSAAEIRIITNGI